MVSTSIGLAIRPYRKAYLLGQPPTYMQLCGTVLIKETKLRDFLNESAVYCGSRDTYKTK
jgi:hypothetical protein